MLSRVRQAIAPVYLLLCLVLGGSAQAIWGNLILQLLGLAILVWAVFAKADAPLAAPARQLFIFVLCSLAVVAISLVPLPPALWSSLGLRGQLAEDYRLLGLAAPALPLSLAPYQTLDAIVKFVPPLAVLAVLLRLKAYRPVWMVAALLLGTFAAIILGALQATSSGGNLSWYPYRDTNVGLAVGFFANANHMATLLLICIPFLAAIPPAAKSKNVQRYSAFIAVTVGALLVLILGLALNGSLAGYGLLLPTAAASLLIVVPRRSRLVPWVVGAAALLMVGALAVVQTSHVGESRLRGEASSSVGSRQEMLSTTAQAMSASLPFGTGLGTFPEVYHLFEDPARVTSTYVVHAHNDYAELALELGLPGIALVLLFLAWWLVAVWRVWRSAEAGPFVRAATIATAIILIHSIVDFPLRTGAIAACFAFGIALMADRRAPAKMEAADLRPARHIVFR